MQRKRLHERAAALSLPEPKAYDVVHGVTDGVRP